MAKPAMAFGLSRDDRKFRVCTLLHAALEHTFKIAVGWADGHTVYEQLWQGEITGWERKSVYAANEEIFRPSRFNRARAAEEVISGLPQQHERCWRVARAAIPGHLGRQPKDIRMRTEQERPGVEAAFWVQMHTAIEDGITRRFPE